MINIMWSTGISPVKALLHMINKTNIKTETCRLLSISKYVCIIYRYSLRDNFDFYFKNKFLLYF